MSLNAQKVSYLDIPKYLKAFEYIQSDSINKDKKIKISNMVVDLDRFWFRSDLRNELHLMSVIDSLTKFSWFENFISFELYSSFEHINNSSAKSIVFFSLVEKNTLRADLFFDGMGLSNYDAIIRQNRDKVYAYLFIFNKDGCVTRKLRSEMIYEPF